MQPLPPPQPPSLPAAAGEAAADAVVGPGHGPAATPASGPPPVHDPVRDDEGQRMPFLDHLSELRTRLRNSILGLIVSTCVAYAFRGQLLRFFSQPLIDAFAKVPPEWRALNFTSPLEAFMVPFKISIIGGLFLGLPIIFWQLWLFISPGLYPRERRYALPVIAIAVALFFSGSLFAYYFVLPKSYAYFMGYASDPDGIVRDVFTTDVKMNIQIRPMITLDDYWSLTSKLLLIFGAVFELPLVLGVLSILGLVSPAILWRFNRYAILISFVAGAVLTPGDLVVGQIAMGCALTVLYNVSILISFVVGRRRSASADDSPASGDSTTAGATG